MRIDSKVPRGSRLRSVRSTPRVAVPAVAAVWLLTAVLGCGADRGARTAAEKPSGGETPPTAGATAGQEARPAPGSNRVLLTDKTCVDFEPHWTTIRVGQSLTWQSDLKGTVTIHVPAGAFDRTEFTVRAGGSVTSGPARNPGSYAITTEPAACRGIPRGAEGPAPGLTVEGGD